MNTFMQNRLTVVLASSNPGKLAELRKLLGDLPIELVTLTEALGLPHELREDGDTFEANAVQKAKAACRLTQLCAIADDSGLEVDALGGRPGARSARFAHDRATDSENNAQLLRELEDVPDEQRQARFRCVLALVSPWQAERAHIAEGACQGSIARAARGSGGFGYDPLFVVSEFPGRAMAELSQEEKNSISHRSRAVQGLHATLFELVSEQLNQVERICR
ncbi:MAG TPA: RdgB/HAM1 family non-canonical purine NTP pyrophosphatase [Polyangiaceae bacterium]|nr:RdgB/HAM1 family non-canonical purine NTP pyrophosphatase [Polyangiaceae bacterium]